MIYQSFRNETKKFLILQNLKLKNSYPNFFFPTRLAWLNEVFALMKQFEKKKKVLGSHLAYNYFVVMIVVVNFKKKKKKNSNLCFG